MHNSSIKWGHMGNFDLELSKHNFPTNPMGSSGTLWARRFFIIIITLIVSCCLENKYNRNFKGI